MKILLCKVGIGKFSYLIKFLIAQSNFELYFMVHKHSGRFLKGPISQDLSKVNSEVPICVPFIWHTSNPPANSWGSDNSRALPCHNVKKSNFLRHALKMDNLNFAFLSIFLIWYSRMYLLGHVSEKFNPKSLETRQKRTIKIWTKIF